MAGAVLASGVSVCRAGIAAPRGAGLGWVLAPFPFWGRKTKELGAGLF